MSMLEFKDEDVPSTIRDENNYRWIDATGITVNDCNLCLKCILQALYEILDGKENKTSKDLDNINLLLILLQKHTLVPSRLKWPGKF
ncbi:12961_t:CDS:2 [Acaulospora morrowiae]|uniref:12961_t:CDS:1 n=1 Tax=Acaulospora morrowiae TaxID=94023 RepID=A0A9N9CYY4_9GLOM|nr:12961_t:CDS:2 [Acaulospora morrowiae]